jgi:hypothetical protein
MMFTVTVATVLQEWTVRNGDILEQTFILESGDSILNIGRGSGYRVDLIRIDRRTYAQDDDGNHNPRTEVDVTMKGRPLTAMGAPDKRTNKASDFLDVASEADIDCVVTALPEVIHAGPHSTIDAYIIRSEVECAMRDRLARTKERNH